jgi:hypothetical protein
MPHLCVETCPQIGEVVPHQRARCLLIHPVGELEGICRDVGILVREVGPVRLTTGVCGGVAVWVGRCAEVC